MNLLCVDMGTTNTRVWWTCGARVIAESRAAVGVRDTARDGSVVRVHEALRACIDDVLQTSADDEAPTCIAAAGMITSGLGLCEVPHVEAPAGPAELARSVVVRSFSQISPLPFLFIPGVRSGQLPSSRDAVGTADIMRGEETLCLGLMRYLSIRPPLQVLNLGSHWKLIDIDPDGRIVRSSTTLTGELLHAVQSQTILASAVGRDRPATVDADWFRSGMAQQDESGLGRALFCVRLLELSHEGTAAQRWSYLLGAHWSSDRTAWIQRGRFAADRPVLVVGPASVSGAVAASLECQNAGVRVVDQGVGELAWLRGLEQIVSMRLESAPLQLES